MSVENEPRNQVAVGTVAWGVILLVIAGIAFAVAMFDISTVTPAIIGWGVVALGGLLVVAAIVGVVARAVRPEAADRASAGPVPTGPVPTGPVPTGPVPAGPTTDDGPAPVA